MADNLNRFIIPSIAGPARLVPLAALADSDFSVPALRQAAQRGRLDAVQSADGTWRASRQAVQSYKRDKHRRRPSPRDEQAPLPMAVSVMRRNCS